MASDDITRQLRRAEYLRQYFAATGREYATGKNIKCPNAAAHAHGDANPSARVYENPDGALVKCHGCGGSWDIFSLWQLDNGGTFPEAKAALCDLCGIASASGDANASRAAHTSGGNVAEVRAPAGAQGERGENGERGERDGTRATQPDKQTAEHITICATTFQAGADGEAGRAYLAGRGISIETARRFNVGYDAQAGWTDGKRGGVIIPNGAGYTIRFLSPQTCQDGRETKAMFKPKGTDRPIFNVSAMREAAKANTPVFIVEGEVDALSIAEVGGVAVAVPAGGYKKTVQAVTQIGRGVYVPCMDRDEAGEAAQAKLVAELRKIGGEVYVYADAPKILMPDTADGTHPKDANDALRADAAAFRASVAEIVSKAQAYAKAEEEKNKPYITLAEIPEPTDEANNPRALFKRGYLRKGGGIIAASVAGAGKSTFSLQCALHWVLGAPCFGIEPVRPLKVAVIQAEDDVEELAMFRANMKQGLSADGFAPDRIDEALGRVQIRTDFLGKTGAEFANALGNMQSKYHYDLVIVNPLNSYFDGDISLNKDATEFFRKMIDPVIKNAATECGIFFIHHMAKPAKGKDAATFAKGAYAQYALQGGAELNNWARAVLIMIPFENAPDFWTLTAAKRYKPLAWKDADGNPTKDKIIAYSDNCIYWRVPSADEIAAAKRGETPSRKQETDEERKRREDRELQEALKEIADYLTNLKEPISKSKLYTWCDKNPSAVFKGFRNHINSKDIPKKPCFLAYELIIAEPLRYGVGYHVGKYRNGKPYETYGGLAPVTGGTGAATATAQAEPSASATDTDIHGTGDTPDETDIDELVF